MPYVTARDCRIYYETDGSGPAVLLIHGAAQDTLSWRFVIPALVAEGYSVWAIDLPGHGKSSLPKAGPVNDLAVYADYALAFAEAVGLEQVTAVGHSMAGGIILHMALKQAARLKGAVVVDGAGFTNRTYNDEFFEQVIINPTDWFEVNFRTICSKETSPERVDEIAFDVLRCAPPVAWNDILAYSRLDLSPVLSQVQVPVHFIHGNDDWSITPEMARQTNSLLPTPGELIVLEGVGHFPHVECPEKFNPALLQILARLR